MKQTLQFPFSVSFKTLTYLPQHFSCVAVKKTVFSLDGLYAFFHATPVNPISKWTSLCLAIDFKNDARVLYLNGKNSYERGRALRPMNGKLSNATTLPMVVRLGHYFFDNKPLIGRLVDVNIWNRWEKDIYRRLIFNRLCYLKFYLPCACTQKQQGDENKNIEK